MPAEMWHRVQCESPRLTVCDLLAQRLFPIAQEVHFSPEERVDIIDASLIVGAVRSIDFAAYSLTDTVILDALEAADERGVAIRIILDLSQPQDFVRLEDLSNKVQIKRSGRFMRLKAYEIDGELLRTGSENFSVTGQRQQDNDLIVIRNAGAALKFDAHFGRMWNAAQPMIEFRPAIKALEPK